MKVYETQLPGIGRRYQVVFSDDGTLTIVVSNDGTRKVYWKQNPDEDSQELFRATESNARKLAEIFDGTYFEPVPDDIDEALAEAPIKWVKVPRGASVAGQAIKDIGVRSRTGVTVLAIKRGPTTIADITPETRLQADDTLVVVGDNESHEAFKELLELV